MRLLERLWGHSIKLRANRPRSVKELRGSLLVLCARWSRRHPHRREADSEAKEDAPTCEEMVDAVVRRLEERGDLEDARFARWWAEQRVAFRPKPRALVAAELRYRHAITDDDVLQEALERAGADDLEACRREARRLGRRRSGDKLTQSLMRQGFTFKVVEAAMKAEGFFSVPDDTHDRR